MASQIPDVVVLGINQFGNLLVPPLLTSIHQLHGEDQLLAVGLLNWVSPTTLPNTPLPPVRVPDVTPTPAEVQSAREANKFDSSPAPIVHVCSEKLSDVMSPADPQNPELVVAAGLHDIEYLAPFLVERKRHHPTLSSSLVVQWPEPGHGDAAATRGLALLAELHSIGAVDGIDAIHPRSSLSREIGEDALVRLVATVKAAQVVAHRMDDRNKRLGQISRSVGTRSPFAAMAIQTVSVSTGRLHWTARVPWLRRAIGGTLVYGDPADCFAAATSAAGRLLRDPSARTIDVPFDEAAPPYELLIVVPFHSSDSRFPPLANDLRHWAAREVPLAGTPTIVAGSGWNALTRQGRYICLVAWIFGAAPSDMPSLRGHVGEEEVERLRLDRGLDGARQDA